jgi:hypothetical protein
MIRKSRMVLAAPDPLLTPPPSSSPPKVLLRPNCGSVSGRGDEEDGSPKHNETTTHLFSELKQQFVDQLRTTYDSNVTLLSRPCASRPTLRFSSTVCSAVDLAPLSRPCALQSPLLAGASLTVVSRWVSSESS